MFFTLTLMIRDIMGNLKGKENVLTYLANHSMTALIGLHIFKVNLCFESNTLRT